MDATFLASTRNSDHVVLGTGGQRVTRCWDQITGYLEQSFGPAYARLFAEPTANPTTATTDWYATGTGDVLHLADLSEAEQAAARARLGELLSEISAASGRLKASKRDDERLLGELLRLALVVPGEDAVWVQRRPAGETGEGPPLQPILAGWGQTLNGQAPAPELLLGVAGAYRRPANLPPMRIVGPPPPPPPTPRRLWLWTLLGALLLALLLLLLLLWRDPFGWFQVPPAQCVVAPGQLGRLGELREAEAREAQLRQEIARLSLDLGNRRVACPPPPAPPPQRTEAVPPPVPAPRDINRARDRQARAGAVQIILAWDDVNDLDLSVSCPDGSRIDYNNLSACGGQLDTDSNRMAPFTAEGVESVAFADPPASGSYAIRVHHYPRGGQPIGPSVSALRVTIRQQGLPDRVLTGRAARGQVVEVGRVDVP